VSDAWKKEEYQQALKEKEQQDALRATQSAFLQPEEIKGDRPSVAMRVLAQSAGAHLSEITNLEIPPAPTLSVTRQDNLEKDGCDLIKAAYVFLELLECPPDARDFVVCLMGISRGNASEYIIITDEQIAAHMGYKDRKVITRKREALIKWEQKNDYAIIKIHQREFDREKKKFKPTEYQVIITDFVAEFVRLARHSFSWKRNQRGAIESSVETGLKQTALQVAENIPNSEIIRRSQAARNVTPSLGKRDVRRDSDRRLFREFEVWCREQTSHGFNLYDRAEEIQEELRSIIDRTAKNGQKPQ